MKLHLYSLKDKLLGVFLTPFPARADVEAVRQITAALKDPQMSTQGLVTNPSDYALYWVGTFDDERGYFKSTDMAMPNLIKEVKDLVQPPPGGVQGG